MEDAGEILSRQVREHIGIEVTDWSFLLGLRFHFIGENGYVAGGQITHVEYLPSEFFRLWGTGEHYIEWKPLRTTPLMYSYRHLGRSGTFHLIT